MFHVCMVTRVHGVCVVGHLYQMAIMLQISVLCHLLIFLFDVTCCNTFLVIYRLRGQGLRRSKSQVNILSSRERKRNTRTLKTCVNFHSCLLILQENYISQEISAS